MGQKVNPKGLRIGIIKDWDSKWYAEKDYAKYLKQDIDIRNFLETRLKEASVANIQIQRTDKFVKLSIHSGRPGIIIGKGGAGITELQKELKTIIKDREVEINIVEIKNPDMNAKLVAENIARQLENRQSFRIVQKRVMQRAMQAGAKGIKTLVSGRLGGVDMARSEGYSEGNVPLQTLRADIDYATAEADTTYGKLGIKIWIYKGEILPKKEVK